MFVTLVAVLCHVLPAGPGDCVEELSPGAVCPGPDAAAP